jgi:hypothetical protein
MINDFLSTDYTNLHKINKNYLTQGIFIKNTIFIFFIKFFV